MMSEMSPGALAPLAARCCFGQQAGRNARTQRSQFFRKGTAIFDHSSPVNSFIAVAG